MPASIVLFLALVVPSQPHQSTPLHQLLTQVAIAEGLMTKGECLTDDLDLATEFVLGSLARGYRTWPFPEYVQRLPSREVSLKALEENYRFCEWCQRQLFLCPWNEAYYRDMLEDARWRWGVWEKIRDASYEYKAPYYTRLHLHQLREAIGGEAFARGLWPHPLPIEWFARE